jgi:tRNA(Ile)-lysidine synthase
LPPGPALTGAPTEDAARQARLNFFEAVASRTGIHKLALAHTADDQAETFLLRLLRGAGVTGLVGILEQRQLGSLCILRPLLKVRRDEVVEYLKSRQLTWRKDASNADRQFLRNRIRHELLPLLEREYNPRIRDVLLRTAELLRDEDELLTKLAEAVEMETLWNQPVALQRRVLRLWLGEGLDFEHVEAVRQLAPGAEAMLPGGLIVYREDDTLRKASRSELERVTGRWPLNLAGETAVRELGVRLVVGSEGERFDADALGTGSFLRTWENGDRFQPLGMTGEKKLQDFFVDEKIPRHSRGRVPLLCAADGRIAWVVGHRIAEPFKVTEQTRRVLRIGVRG